MLICSVSCKYTQSWFLNFQWISASRLELNSDYWNSAKLIKLSSYINLHISNGFLYKDHNEIFHITKIIWVWNSIFIWARCTHGIRMYTIINLQHIINLFLHCRINHNPCMYHLSAIFVTIEMLYGLQKSTSTACITQWYTALVWLILIYVSSKSPRNIFAGSNRFSGQWL